MSPQGEVFATPELLIEILSYVKPGDLDRARKVDGPWRAVVDGTPTLVRMRAVSPLKVEDFVQMSVADLHASGAIQRRPSASRKTILRRSDLEDQTYYDISGCIKVHPALSDALNWPYPDEDGDVWINARECGLYTTTIRENEFVTQPPITTAIIHFSLDSFSFEDYDGAGNNEDTSSATLRVMEGIRLRDILNIYSSMRKTETDYGGRVYPTWEHQIYLWSFRSIAPKDCAVRKDF